MRSPLATEHTGDVDDRGCDAGWPAAARELFLLSGLDQFVGLGFHLRIESEATAESGDVILRSCGHDLHLEFPNHESVRPADLLPSGAAGLADLIERSGDPTLPACCVQAGRGDALDGASANESLLHGLLVIHSRSLTNGFRQLEATRHPVEFRQCHGEIPFRRIRDPGSLLPFAHSIELGAISTVDRLPGVVLVLPVDVGRETFVVEHHGHRGSSPSTLISLFGREDPPLSTLVDGVVLEDDTTILTRDLTTILIAMEIPGATFGAFHEVLDLLVLHGITLDSGNSGQILCMPCKN